MTTENVARVGDIGIGVCHNHKDALIYTTTFNSGSDIFSVDGSSVCTVGSTGISSCGHSTIAVTGSTILTDRGLGVHREGDTGNNGYGSYVVTSGSPVFKSA